MAAEPPAAAAAAPWTGGELVFAGGTDWSQLGKGGGGKGKKDPQAELEREQKYPNLPAPHRLKVLVGIRIAFIAGGPAAAHALAGDMNGRLYSWGRNDKGQLGHGDFVQRNVPTIVAGLEGKFIITAAGGKSHSVTVTQEGESYTFGSNLLGQLGTGSAKSKPKQEEMISKPVKAVIAKADSCHCGVDFSMWLCDGQVFAAGSGQYGQLGDGSDHSYNAKDSSIQMVVEPAPTPKAITTFASKVIKKLTCGQNHSIAVDSEGAVYTWGNGGYGRLGHKVQQDELKPRKVDFFAGRYVVPSNTVIAASQTASFAVGPGGQLYSWGKLKANGDNQMYPNPLSDLSGWAVRSMACGPNTFIVAADNSVISWGQATNGELAYGPAGKKSSANPEKVHALDGMHTHQVAGGLGFSMYLVDPTHATTQALPVYESTVVEAEPTPEAAAEAAAKGKGGKRKAADTKEPKEKAPAKKKK